MATAATPRSIKTVAIRTFKTSIDIPENQRAALIALLNARLADTIDLKTQTKYAHWNVKGLQFQQLHELFDAIAGRLEAHSDLIAERITALGGVANGTARQAASASSLAEYELDAVAGADHVRALAARLTKLAATVRAAIEESDKLGDKSTADLFTEISRASDKDLWFLEAHLQQ
ncbi:MAG TPA: DNA starvation/stationary phase protection protein Dps [Terriglobales bacterium]|nr:DNA starvation/stationary phase protection protein Dps [Terriglobales bacterium]